MIGKMRGPCILIIRLQNRSLFRNCPSQTLETDSFTISQVNNYLVNTPLPCSWHMLHLRFAKSLDGSSNIRGSRFIRIDLFGCWYEHLFENSLAGNFADEHYTTHQLLVSPMQRGVPNHKQTCGW